MEEVNNKQSKLSLLAKYGTVAGFLCLEVLAFISFYLGHSFILYGCLSIALAIILLIVTWKQIKFDGISSFAFFLFPVVVYGLLTALSSFNYGSLGAIGTAESVFIPIAFLFISVSGYLVSLNEKFSTRILLLVIYSALGIFVLLNLIATMVEFCPFYALIYKNYYMFYAGKPSSVPISSMAYMLYGFQFQEVSIEYFTLFPSILLTAVIPLFFIKYKENKVEFLIYLACSVVAFLSLLFTVTKLSIITDTILVLGIAIIICSGKFIKVSKVFNKIMIALGIIVLLVLIVLFLNAQSWSFVKGLQNVIAGNGVLNRLFNTNRWAQAFKVILQDMFSSWKLFGVYVGDSSFNYPNFVQQNVSNSWLFDNLLSSGLFGALFFLIAIIIGIRRLFMYYKNHSDANWTKLTIFGYVLAFLVIGIFSYDVTPLINSTKMSPFFTSAPLLIVIFLLAYTFARSNKHLVKEPVKETEPTNTEENQNDVFEI